MKINLSLRLVGFKLILVAIFSGILILPVLAQNPIGYGWAKNAVNAVVFRKNSVVSHQNDQYTAYYDSTGNVMLAKRKLNTDKWQVIKTKYKGNVKDAHNDISIMVDGQGYLHLAWDHHNNPLRYSRSVKPGSLDLTEQLPMTGKQENKVSYPEFYRLPTGDLLFLYRDGGSGNGNLVLNRYEVKSKQWTRLYDVLIDGEGERNAYWQAAVGENGTIHLSWVWRESPDVASNHDLAYARSVDGGKTWVKTTGEKYQMPIKASTAEYARKIPEKSELINQTSMYADAAGNPYIGTYWRPEGTAVPQYHVVYHDGGQWQTRQVSERKTPFSLSGGGTKKIPISRPQVMVKEQGGKKIIYFVYRDVERNDYVTLAQSTDLTKNTWQVKDLNAASLGNWEPTYDTELWKKSKILHLFIQKVGQGDGEKLENMEPQPVYILEWKP
jgi:hypothetical protein